MVHFTNSRIIDLEPVVEAGDATTPCKHIYARICVDYLSAWNADETEIFAPATKKVSQLDPFSIQSG